MVHVDMSICPQFLDECVYSGMDAIEPLSSIKGQQASAESIERIFVVTVVKTRMVKEHGIVNGLTLI